MNQNYNFQSLRSSVVSFSSLHTLVILNLTEGGPEPVRRDLLYLPFHIEYSWRIHAEPLKFPKS
jgi:hypothetical protein